MIDEFPLYTPGKIINGKVGGYDITLSERTVGPRHDPYVQRVIKISKGKEKVIEAFVLFHGDQEDEKITSWLKENLGVKTLDDLEATCMKQEAAIYYAGLVKAAKKNNRSVEEEHEEWELMAAADQAFYGGP